MLSVAYLSFGVYDSDLPVIDSVIAGYPAEQAGLQAGDRIIGIGDIDISTLEDSEAVERIRAFINENGSDPFTITILRNDKTMSFDVIPILNEADNRYQLDLLCSRNTQIGFFSALGMSFVRPSALLDLWS